MPAKPQIKRIVALTNTTISALKNSIIVIQEKDGGMKWRRMKTHRKFNLLQKVTIMIQNSLYILDWALSTGILVSKIDSEDLKNEKVKIRELEALDQVCVSQFAVAVV